MMLVLSMVLISLMPLTTFSVTHFSLVTSLMQLLAFKHANLFLHNSVNLQSSSHLQGRRFHACFQGRRCLPTYAWGMCGALVKSMPFV